MHLQKLPGNIMTKNRYLSNYIPSLHLKTSGTAIFSSPEDFLGTAILPAVMT